MVEGLLDSFFFHARAPDAVGHAVEPRALALGRRLGAEVVEVLRELRRPWLAEGEAESGTGQGRPLRRGQARRCGQASPRRGHRLGGRAGARVP